MNEKINIEDHIFFCGNKALLTGENNINYRPVSVLCRYDNRFDGINGGRVTGIFKIFNQNFYLVTVNGGLLLRNFILHDDDIIKKTHSANRHIDEIKYSIFYKFWIYIRIAILKKYPNSIKINTFFYDGFHLRAFKKKVPSS